MSVTVLNTVVWSTLITREDWRELRKELRLNGFSVPFGKGVTANPRTGYRMTNEYDIASRRLTITVYNPYLQVQDAEIHRLLDRWFGKVSTVQVA